MNMQQIPRRGIIAVIALAVLVVSAVGLGVADASTVAPETAPPELVSSDVINTIETGTEVGETVSDSVAPITLSPPTEQSFSVGPLGFSNIQKNEAYRAFNQAESGVQAAMNAIAAIRKGEVAGEPLTQSQLSAIVEQGLSGMALAQARILDGLAVLSLTQTALDNFVAANPVPDREWCYEITNAWSGQSGCMDSDDPAYVPLP